MRNIIDVQHHIEGQFGSGFREAGLSGTDKRETQKQHRCGKNSGPIHLEYVFKVGLFEEHTVK